LTADTPTKVCLLVYSKTRTDESSKQVAFCVVKNNENERVHKMPSFQQEGLGFGSAKPFDLTVEPNLSYNVISYCTKEELAGEFMLCIFSEQDASVSCVEAKSWPCEAKESSEWKDDTAGGSGENYNKNPKFFITPKEDATVLIMVRQSLSNVAGALLPDGGGHRIVPSKFYVGFYVFQNKVEIAKTEKWVNSYDVYKFVHLQGGKTFTVIPCTQKEGQECAFELHAFSTVKFKLEREE